MNDDGSRFAQLKYGYFGDHAGAQEALKFFSAARSGRSRRSLARLLRHHDDDPISDKETWERDNFDYLLGFFSMVEVGCLAGFLSPTLPSKHAAIARRILKDKDVRRYYEEHYPVLLPQAHLRRVEGTPLTPDPDSFDIGPGLFDSFFTLTQPMEGDGPIETFLWFLDGGSRGGYDIDDTITVLGNPKRFIHHASARPEDSRDGELDWLSASTQGFLAFMEFGPRLLVVLRASHPMPLLQSAMWHVHGYWLGQMGSHMGTAVKRALQAIGSWEEGLTRTDKRKWKETLEKGRVVRAEQERALTLLSSGEFSHILVRALLGDWVAHTPTPSDMEEQVESLRKAMRREEETATAGE